MPGKKTKRIATKKSTKTLTKKSYDVGPKGGSFRVTKTGKKVYKATDKMMSSWSSKAPAKGNERQRMLQKCGVKCFLDPKNLKYPICVKNTCTVDCQGLTAAKIRVAQWAPNLLKKANNVSSCRKN